jgi:hypothetical protein
MALTPQQEADIQRQRAELQKNANSNIPGLAEASRKALAALDAQYAAATGTSPDQTLVNAGTDYETTAEAYYDPLSSDRRNFMPGRDPGYADSVRRVAYDTGNEARVAGQVMAEGQRSYGQAVANEGMQQALDAGQYGRDQGAAVQNQAAYLGDYAQGAANSLWNAGGGITQRGDAAASGILQRGDAAAGALSGAGANAAYLGQTGQQALMQAGGQAAAVGAAANQGLNQAGTGAAQALSAAAGATQQAGRNAANVGSDVRSDLSGGAERSRIAGQQALGSLAGAGSSALMTGRDQASVLSSYGANATGRDNIDTNFNAANQALSGAAQTAQRASDAAYLRGGQVADTARDAAADSAGRLRSLEATEGPSAAQALLNSSTQRNINQQLSMARSGRGLGGSASAADNAARNIAGILAESGNSAAALRAQENASWRQRQAAAEQAGGQLNLQASQIGLGAQQLGLQGGQLSTQTQLAQGNQLGNQAQFGTQSAIQQRALNDQTGLAYNLAASQTAQQGEAQRIAALQAGHSANLSGQGVSNQALAAGGSAALQGQGLNVQGSTAAGQLIGQGQAQRLDAITAGQNLNMQGQGLNLQGVSQGVNAAQQGQAAYLGALQGAGQLQTQAATNAGQLQTNAATAGAGVQQAGAQLGVGGLSTAGDLYARGAGMGVDSSLASQSAYLGAGQLGLGAMGQAADIYNAGVGNYYTGLGAVNDVTGLELQGGIAAEDAVTRRDAAIRGQLAADAAARNALIGGGIAGAATLGAAYLSGGTG